MLLMLSIETQVFTSANPQYRTASPRRSFAWRGDGWPKEKASDCTPAAKAIFFHQNLKIMKGFFSPPNWFFSMFNMKNRVPFWKFILEKLQIWNPLCTATWHAIWPHLDWLESTLRPEHIPLTLWTWGLNAYPYPIVSHDKIACFKRVYATNEYTCVKGNLQLWLNSNFCHLELLEEHLWKTSASKNLFFR